MAVCAISRDAIVQIYNRWPSMDGSGRLNYKNWHRQPIVPKTIGRKTVALADRNRITVNCNRAVPTKTVWPYSTISTMTVYTGTMLPAIIANRLCAKKTMPFWNMSATQIQILEFKKKIVFVDFYMLFIIFRFFSFDLSEFCV